MKKIIATMFMVLLCVLPVQATWLFDGTNDYVSLSLNSVFQLPDSDWSIYGRFKLSTNSVNPSFANIKLLDIDNGTGNSEYAIEITHVSGTTDEVQFFADDNQIDTVIITSTSSPLTSDTNWHHILAIRSGNTFTLYLDGSQVATATNVNIDASSDMTDPLLFGSESPSGIDRWFPGELAEWAKWDRALNADEIAGLSKGFSPNCYPGTKMYAPMIRNYTEVANGLAVTNSGSIISDHPRIIYCD